VAYAGESTWEKEAGQGWGGRMGGRGDGAGSPVSGGARDTLEKKGIGNEGFVVVQRSKASVGDFLREKDIQCLTKQMKALIISFRINLLRFRSVFIFPRPFFHMNV
jgi:hypothetical protein